MAKAAKQVSNENREKCRIVTPPFRVSYPHLFKPTSMPGTNQPPKYSITMLFPKDEDMTLLRNAIKHAKINQFGSKENWPESIVSCVEDGDKPKFADKPGYAGHWVVKATTSQDQKPGVVDRSNRPITEASELYAGCYARASIFARVWEFPKDSGRFGIHFILDHVQKYKDGEPFSSRKSADQVFDPIEGDDDEDEAGADEESEEEIDF